MDNTNKKRLPMGLLARLNSNEFKIVEPTNTWTGEIQIWVDIVNYYENLKETYATTPGEEKCINNRINNFMHCIFHGIGGTPTNVNVMVQVIHLVDDKDRNNRLNQIVKELPYSRWEKVFDVLWENIKRVGVKNFDADLIKEVKKLKDNKKK